MKPDSFCMKRNVFDLTKLSLSLIFPRRVKRRASREVSGFVEWCKQIFILLLEILRGVLIFKYMSFEHLSMFLTLDY